jgi:hypothetical protein
MPGNQASTLRRHYVLPDRYNRAAAIPQQAHFRRQIAAEVRTRIGFNDLLDIIESGVEREEERQ